MRIFLGVPSYDCKLEAKAFECILYSGQQGVVHYEAKHASLLAYCFNQLYCSALNKRKDGITHFLLLHSDIIPQDTKGWVKTLAGELLYHQADVMSVVVPLKGPMGVTSTALDKSCPENLWAVKRYTMKEIMELPETFTHPDLLVNSGCLLMDITKPWADKVHFEINDKILQGADGLFHPHVESEDWNISKQIKRLGGKIYATRKVEVNHVGRSDYNNQCVWGEESDPLWKDL